MSILLVVILPFVVAMGAILAARSGRWKPQLSEPHCARCDYDLRGHLLQADGPRICPECGADLTAAGAVNFGRVTHRPTSMALGSVLLSVAVLIGVGLLFISRQVATPVAGPAAVSTKTNAALLTDLKTTAGQPWTWKELESRFKRGALTNAEAEKAIDELIVWIGKERARMGWMGAFALYWSGDFVKAVVPSLSSQKQVAFYQAYYGRSPKVSVSRRVREGKAVNYRVQWGGPFNLSGAKFVKALREVKLADGKTPRLRSSLAASSNEADWLSADGPADLVGTIALDLPKGEHELTFVVDGGVLPEGSELVGIGNRPGQKERWLKPLATWQATEKRKVTVVGKGEDVAQLVTDPAKDPVTTGAVRLPRIVVKKAPQGVSMQVKWDLRQGAVDVLMSVAMRVNGKEERMGMISIHDNHFSSMSDLTLKSLPAEVKVADVILRPNPELATQLVDVEKIWGKEIVFEQVPLERYDLDVEKG